MKNIYIYQVPAIEWAQGKAFMLAEVAHLSNNHQIRKLLQKAIANFEAGKFSYDGATYVDQREETFLVETLQNTTPTTLVPQNVLDFIITQVNINYYE